MPKLVRLGDASDHGGTMITASATFTNQDKKGCVTGDIHHCPKRGHGDTPVTSNSKAKSNGRSVLRVGDIAGCGAVLIEGSANTSAT